MPTGMLRAYLSTRYEVDGIPVFIGRSSGPIDALLARHAVRVGVLVTAWNPMSRRMPPGWNARMQLALRARSRRMIALPAVGGWRRWSEEHVLVLAEPGRVACIARRFRQRAIVVVRRGRAAELRVV